MPKFKKTEDELESLFDKWLYALKNLPRLLERPAALQERIFKKFFDVAQTANLSKEEYAKYFESEKNYYDLDGAFRTASQKGFTRGMKKGKAEGRAEGLAEGMEKGVKKGKAEGRAEGIEDTKRENALRMIADGMSSELIAKYTGLDVETINKLGR
jgi:predicted transposase/invertase (TIGR01784 family)